MNNIQRKTNIIWLGSSDCCVSRMGSKATVLAKLMSHGIPVPDGFCVTVEGCETAFSHYKSRTDKKLPDFPSVISNDIRSAYQSLCGKDSSSKAVAVRSSAIAEDLMNRSYAGQYESYLNIMDEDRLIQAIQDVWKSTFAKRVEAYKQYHAIPDAPNGIAVLIQRMVPAILSGVLFTSDPSNANSQCMIIEAVEGTADEYISGRVTPSRFSYHSPTTSLKCIHPASLSERYSGPDFWAPLIKLVERIEKILGAEQDIEWAFDGVSFWILQSRPITVTFQPPDTTHLTRANIGEVMPGVLTPLTISVFLKTLGAFETKNQDVKPTDEIAIINGRAYIKIQGLWNSYSNIIGVNPAIVLSEGIGCQIDGMEEQLALNSKRIGVADKLIKTTYVWSELITCTWVYHRLFRRLKKCFNAQLMENRGVSANRNTSNEIWSQLKENVDMTSRLFLIHMQSTYIALCAYALMRTVLGRFVDSSEAKHVMSLAVPLSQDVNTYQDIIQRLSQRALLVPSVADKLRNNTIGNLVSSLSQDNDTMLFLQEVRTAVGMLGDRAVQEFELNSPRWSEDPELFLSAIKSIIEGPEESPLKAESKKIKPQTGIDQALKKVPIINRLWINRIYKTLRRYSGLREQTKAALMKSFGRCRRSSLAISDILKQNGIIAENGDIFFFSLDEIHDLVFKKKTETDIRSIVKKRKQEYERNIKEHQKTSNSEELNKSRTTMKGTPVSGGLATGVARLIHNPCQASIKEGEILVAENIDPGWMPLFMLAGGIVTEIGGMLSHMATLAREAQKAAVFSVPEAMKYIRDGEIITVDGFTGKIYLKHNRE